MDSNNGRTTRSNSGGRKKSWSERLKLVHIYERITGQCLYEKCWKWSVHGHLESVSALVQSFMQLAREIDAGEVSYANFECPIQSKDKDSKHSRTTSGASGSKERKEMMQMLSTQNGLIQVVLFYDMKGVSQKLQPSERFVERLLTKFHENFHVILQNMVENKDAQSEKQTKDMYKAPFYKFDKILDEIMKQIIQEEGEETGE